MAVDFTITKDMMIGDIIKIDTVIMPILMHEGLHCLGCSSSDTETLEQACFVHNLDVDEVVDDLNFVLTQI